MPEKVKSAIIVFILLANMRVFHTLLAPSGETLEAANTNPQTSPLVLIIVLLSNLLLFLLLLPNIKRIASIFAREIVVSAILLLVLLSAFWSVDGAFSIRRAILLLASTTAAIYIGQRYYVDEIQAFFRNAILVMATLSLMLYAVVPKMVMDLASPEALRGLVGHKNTFGLYMGLLGVIFLAGGMNNWRSRALKCVVVAATMALLVLSHSGTAWIAFLVVAAMFPLLKVLQNRPSLVLPKVILGVILAIPLLLTFLGGLDPVLGSLGKDATLTGRTKLWALLTDAIAQKPWLGYGYDAYLGSQGSEWRDVVKKVEWIPMHAHSGYLQIALSIGFVGLSIFILLLIKCVLKAVVFARENPGPAGLFPLAALLYLILHNVTETTFLQSSGLANILLFAIYVSMTLHPFLRTSESVNANLGALEQDFGDLSASLPSARVAHFPGQ
jgi:exopolysaccharide production protein ExoQ